MSARKAAQVAVTAADTSCDALEKVAAGKRNIATLVDKEAAMREEDAKRRKLDVQSCANSVAKSGMSAAAAARTETQVQGLVDEASASAATATGVSQ